MAKLIRMMLTVFGVALLNKMLKGNLRPSTNSIHSGNQTNHFADLQNAIFAFFLTRSRSWIIQPAAISTVYAFFTALMNSMKMDHETKDQVIEIDEYEIVDDIGDGASEGYRVMIHDSR